MMTPEGFRHAKAIFAAASQLEGEARRACVDRMCASDAELREEVESLLAAHDETSDAGTRAHVPDDRTILRGPDDLERRTAELLATAFDGQYTIVRTLGRGGMGAVYLARDIRLGVYVAIKVLRPELAALPESRHRFRREALIAAELRHPNIVRLHQYLEVDGLWCFVMDYVPGGGLDRRLRREGPIPPEETRGYLMELAGALEYAHRRGVIHRDIKPGNILFDAEQRPMLADFGIAKIEGADTLTPANEIRGTPCYMPPEQLKGQADVDERSDIYALGLVGYAMIVGKEPYGGMSLREVLHRKASEDPAPLVTMAPSTPKALADVIMRCLPRNRALRFPNARELKEALERAGETSVPLPEQWAVIPGFGQWAFVWAAFFIGYALLGSHAPREMLFLLVLGALVPLGFTLQVWNLARHGLTRLDVLFLSYWPPQWWGMWWPAMLRRPTDQWFRLPWPARAVRIALSIFFVAMPAMIITQSKLDAPSPVIAGVEYALLLVTALVTTAGVWWTRARGVPAGEAARVLFGATMPTPAWRSPAVARLLAPARGVSPPQHGDPRDYCRAIVEIVRLFPHEVAESGREGVALAKRLLRAVAAYDDEIALLNRDASPAAIDTLISKRTELGPTTTRDSDPRRQLRTAIDHQLSALAAMRRNAEAAAHHREELVDLMRSLWAQLRRMHEESTGPAGVPPGVEDGFRALRHEIEQRLATAPVDGEPRGDDGAQDDHEAAGRDGADAEDVRDDGAGSAAVVRPRRPPGGGWLHIQGSSALGP